MSQRAVLLVNLGSPDSTAITDVAKYLDQFLMDPHVLDFPQWLRALLVKGIILPTRPKKSAAAYREVWTEAGSPLIVISKQLQTALQASSSIPVGLAMRYQNPSIEAGILELLQKAPNTKEILLVPLYPQYAMSTTETVVHETRVILKKLGLHLELKVLAPFYNHPAYIKALAAVAKPYLEDIDHVLFSYHGIPKAHIRKSDCTGLHCLKTDDCCETSSPAHTFCYQHQCVSTMQALAAELGLENYSHSFQSRISGGWLTPYTDKRLTELPAEGQKRIAVLCPAFVADCLETLEEINMEGQEDFLKAGGTKFTYIPCLNDHPAWVTALQTLCDEAWTKTSFLETNSIPHLVKAA